MPVWFCCIYSALNWTFLYSGGVPPFAGLLVAVSIIFSIMAYFYTYVDQDQLDKLFREDTDDEKVKSLNGMKNEAVSMADMPNQTKM